MRFYLLNIVGLAALVAGMVEGVARRPFLEDQTYLTWLIALFFLVGVFCAWRGWWKRAAWIQRRLVLLGLIGTVLGFIITLSGIDPAQVANVNAIPAMASVLFAGVGTALYTTLVGSVGALWLSVNAFLIAGRDD